MDNGILWSFVGMVLAGLTAFAYKHPDSYRKLSLGLIPILLCVVFASVGWNLGQSSAYQMLGPYISPDNVKVLVTTFLDSIEQKYVYDAAMLTVIAYLFLLGYLHHILRTEPVVSTAER